MDFQLVLDLGLVLNYMSKYVTKSDMSNNLAVHRLVKRIHQTSSAEGRSTASFLCRAMGKLLGERIMSKQEKCHLMFGLPIVHCSHQQVNVNLKNDRNAFVVDENSNDDPAETPLMSLVDAYAVRKDSSHWINEVEFLSVTDIETLSLLDFCLQFRVLRSGDNRNKICANRNKIVINFYPNPSSSPESPEYVDYCRYMLMRFRPWDTSSECAWDNYEESEEIIMLWKRISIAI